VQAVTTEGTVGPREKAIAPEADERSPESGWLKNPSTRVNLGLPQRGHGWVTCLALSASTTCLAWSGVILPLRSTHILPSSDFKATTSGAGRRHAGAYSGGAKRSARNERDRRVRNTSLHYAWGRQPCLSYREGSSASMRRESSASVMRVGRYMRTMPSRSIKTRVGVELTP